MRHRTLIRFARQLLLAVTFCAFSTTAPAADATITGIHVHYVGEHTAVKTGWEAMLARCPKRDQPATSSELGRFFLDRYYAANGNEFAEYEEGYLGRGAGVCKVEVLPYKKIRIYHFASGEYLEFFKEGDRTLGWKTRRLPGRRTASTMLEMLGHRAGKMVDTGRKGKFAGYDCALLDLISDRGRIAELCVRDLASNEIRVPSQLELMSRVTNPATGRQDNYVEAVRVNLREDLKRSLFWPAGAPEQSARNGSKANRMQPWCEKQLKATGTDPCKNIPGYHEH